MAQKKNEAEKFDDKAKDMVTQEFEQEQARVAALPPQAKLAHKLLKIYEVMGYLQKKNRNQQQGYAYVSEADFAEKMNDACVANRVVLIPSFPEVELNTVQTSNGKTMHQALVKGKYLIVDAETGFQIEFSMPGVGQDMSDKAIYKAITGAQKYAIFKLAMCSTGNDPEKEDPPQREVSKPPQQAKPASPPAQSTQERPKEAPKEAQKPVDTAKPPQEQPKTQGKPKETPPPTEKKAFDPLEGGADGTIGKLEMPKAPQKPGFIMFRPLGMAQGFEGVKIFFWAERLPTGINIGDLNSFQANMTTLFVEWQPDASKKWAILKSITQEDIPNSDDLDGQADQFTDGPQ